MTRPVARERISIQEILEIKTPMTPFIVKKAPEPADSPPSFEVTEVCEEEESDIAINLMDAFNS